MESLVEHLVDAVQGGETPDGENTRLVAIIDTIAGRMFAIIEQGLEKLQEIEDKREEAASRAWLNLAKQGVNEIEQAGSLAPGLSHQEIYVNELKAAVEEATDAEDFLSRIENLNAKWGSRVKYPLYAGGRKKELTRLSGWVKEHLKAEEQRLRDAVEEFGVARRERIHAVVRENINKASIEFRGLLAKTLEWQVQPDHVSGLRWFLIDAMNDRLFHRIGDNVGPEHAHHQDYLYFALERVMRAVYETFQGLVSSSAKASGDERSRVSGLIDHEIRWSRMAAAKLETRLNTQQLSGPLIVAIRGGLKSGDSDSVSIAPKLFAEVSGCLRTDTSFQQFAEKLRKISGLDGAQHEEIISAIKTAVEPFRSLYYAKITYVRYMKGLKNFHQRLAAGAS